MVSINQRTSFVLFILLVIIFVGCKKSNPGFSDATQTVNPYIYAYTSGVISKGDVIRVRFAKAVVPPDQIGEETAENLIKFIPKIAGLASWEDEQTLLFQPEEWLESGTDYAAIIELKDLFEEVPKTDQLFDFTFRTREQHVILNFAGLKAPNPNNLRKQELKGVLNTSDVAENEAIEKLVTASQSGRNLDIDWQHDGPKAHTFYIKDIDRGDQASNVKVNWNGKPIGVTKSDQKTFEVPALGEFKVMSAEVMQDEEQYISLQFSDPLLSNQNVNGLVSLTNFTGNFRYIIDGNELRIYPSQRLGGERKVTVNEGLKNTMDVKMKQSSEWFVSFADSKPQVKLSGRGVIIPSSDGLIFPFEAVGLNAIDIEVFKIYDNNILQFLQTNRLDGDYQLRRVGRLILQKKISLSTLNSAAKTYSWTRYALDLNELMEQDPNAIYQIRIGFKPEYAVYTCPGEDNESDDNLVVAKNNSTEDGEIISFMANNYYGPGGYYQGYDWSHREDPCKSAYYNNERFVSRNVIASNLGIIAKSGKDKSLFFAISDLRSATPIAGAKVELYDYQQQLIAAYQADNQGLINISSERKPFFAIVRSGEEKGYVRLDDGTSLSLSRFDIAGAITQKGMKGYMYGERGVWRPGDSVYLNFILEDKSGKLPFNYPITFELYDARGQLRDTRTTTENVDRVYPLHFATQSDDPTGSWIAKVKAGGATFNRTLKIETVKPNRLKVDLDFGKEILTAKDEPLNGKLQVNWLHGAPARNLKALVEVDLNSTNTTFEKYADYEFDDPARSFRPQPKTIFENNVSEEGSATFQANIVNTQLIPGKLIARFKTRAFEKGGDFSTDNFTIPYHPFTSYAGLAIPKNKYGSKRIPMNRPSNLSFAAVDTDGNPISGRKLSVGLYRIEWRWWWDRGYDNLTKYNASSHNLALEKSTLTTNSKGEANWEIELDNWGRYMVRVCDTESGHCSGDFFYSGYPYYDDDSGNEQQRQAAAMLAFNADKQKYNVGEEVKLTIPMGKVGKALVTIENGTKVVDSYWVDAQEGENEFTFEAKSEMAPTVYAHVSLLQPHNQVENDLPIRLYGVIPINVEDPGTKLNPELKMPDELQPEQEVAIQVSESNGKEMSYTLAVVDEGLLGLTRFKTPQPWDAFYAREALGVKTWDIYDKVLGAYGGEMERILSIGGDGEIEKDGAENKANRFKPVVMHLGPFKLRKGRTATHKIKMPNYVGAVRTMVVAAQEGAYGNAEKTTPVKQPLMVLATLPRVLGPGEILKLPVSVFAMDKKVKNVTVKVSEASGIALMQGSDTQKLTFDRMGDQIATFDIKMNNWIGVAKFLIEASGNGEKASQEIELEVRNPNPYVTTAQDMVVEAGQSWSPTFEAVGMPGTNSGILEVSSIPPINLGERMDYLLRYPYGCLEQTLSGGFPQLYVNKLMELNEKDKARVARNIDATVNRLKLFQLSNGGFSYWPGNTRAAGWSSTYAGHFLLEAKALGYSVPMAMLSKWKNFQMKMARTWVDNDRPLEYGYYRRSSNQLAQAYRLYTLSLANSPDLAAMNRLRESSDLSLAAKWRLAAAYGLAGKTEVAQDLVDGIATAVEEYTELGGTYGSSLRDRAMILETLTLLKDNTRAANLVKYISEALSKGRWYGTQTVSYCLLAIGKFIGEGEVGEGLKFAYQLGNGKSVNAGSNNPIFQIEVPVDGNQARKLSIKNTAGKTLFARLILTGQPVAGQETAEKKDLNMEIVYRAMNGQPIDPSNIPQGTDFVAEVTVSHPGIRPIPYEEMALTQIFPSGWEIINSRLDGFQSFKNTSVPEYQDFRDDRVNTFFDVYRKNRYTYRVQLNAAYQGRYYLPATTCEAMYDNSIYARQPGQWVEVSLPGEI